MVVLCCGNQLQRPDGCKTLKSTGTISGCDLTDVTPPEEGSLFGDPNGTNLKNEGLISMDRSGELLYHLQYPVPRLSRLQRI